MLYRPILYSILIHAAVAGLLLFSFEFPARTIETPQSERNIVNAVAVDEEKVQQELDRIKEQEQQERRADEQRRQELKQIEQQRQKEEKRLAELKEQQKKETREREAEQQRLAELRKEQQELKEKQKREAEKERKRIEEERRKAEAEKKRLEEEKRKAEEERKRREAEEAMKKQLAEEQRQQEEAQARADQRIINEYGLRIQEAIRRQFNTYGLPEGLACVLQIRTIPGGDVVDVRVLSSSGNSIFDRRAETAVHRASPLPVPDNMRVFEKMREIRLTFAPER